MVQLMPSAFSALTLLVGRQEGHRACKKIEWWGAGVVIYLERGADMHMAQLMSLPLAVSCFSKIQIGFTFLVPAHPRSPGKRAVKRVCGGQHRGCSLLSTVALFCFCKFVTVQQQMHLCEWFICRIESGENIEDNKRNLMMLTQKVFDVIVASSER